eukprot:scaffold20289_cov23-Tisochrysis_lutea.AAC.1
MCLFFKCASACMCLGVRGHTHAFVEDRGHALGHCFGVRAIRKYREAHCAFFEKSEHCAIKLQRVPPALSAFLEGTLRDGESTEGHKCERTEQAVLAQRVTVRAHRTDCSYRSLKPVSIFFGTLKSSHFHTNANPGQLVARTLDAASCFSHTLLILETKAMGRGTIAEMTSA